MDQKQFLQQLDAKLSLMNPQQVLSALREAALGISVEKRDSFLAKLTNESSSEEKILKRQERMKAILHDLNLIDQGQLWFGSKFNLEYQDYLDIGNECLLIDFNNLSMIVIAAERFIYEAIDRRDYQDALIVAKSLFSTSFTVGGECYHYFDSLSLLDLKQYDVIDLDYDLLAYEYLFLLYVCNPLSERPSVLYEVFEEERFGDYDINGLLQYRNDLPEFSQFLVLWKSYLESKEPYMITEVLLKEANLLLADR